MRNLRPDKIFAYKCARQVGDYFVSFFVFFFGYFAGTVAGLFTVIGYSERQKIEFN